MTRRNVPELRRQGTDVQVWPAAVADALGLTRMESRVAALLVQGMSAQYIAATTGRKESTIRSHVKHMFARHGLSRQPELERLVQSVAASPQSPVARLR